VSVGDTLTITGRSGITVLADKLFDDMNYDDTDLLILPGGQPGTTNLKACEKLLALLHAFNDQGKRLAAICAAPTVFGGMGILKGRRAACYPGCEGELTGAIVSEEQVVVDGNLTTSRGAGTAIPFALSLIEQLFDREKADEIGRSIVY